VPICWAVSSTFSNRVNWIVARVICMDGSTRRLAQIEKKIAPKTSCTAETRQTAVQHTYLMQKINQKNFLKSRLIFATANTVYVFYIYIYLFIQLVIYICICFVVAGIRSVRRLNTFH